MKRDVTLRAEVSDMLKRFYTLGEIFDFTAQLIHMGVPRDATLRISGPLEFCYEQDVEVAE